MPLEVGTRLGPYQILAQIGAGGMGEVYRASDTRLDRQVAVKVIAPQWARDRQVRIRFEREARAISSLSHPHVCTLHDIGEQGEIEYLVMEFVEGETLTDRLTRGPLSLDEFVRYGTEIADALEIAHGRGITHRDLKPSNIMITSRGSVKILDFGLAKLEEVVANIDTEATDVFTRPGTPIGTYRYMSPEQIGGEAVGASSDIFSLGIVLYEAIAGRHPFDASSRSELIRNILAAEPVRPSMLRPDIPAGGDALLLHMLAKQSASRPTAAQLRAVLRTAVAEPPPQRQARPVRHVVGRERERAEIIDRLGSDRGAVISVTGEAGLGKTTLVEECLAGFARNSAAIAVGRCSERLAGSEAYLPILEALADFIKNDASLAQSLKLLASAWYRQVAPVPESAPDASAPTAAAGQERLKRELSTFFEAATKIRPVILFLDDVHWADVSTVDLIAYLAAHMAALRLFIIVTTRHSELLLQKHPFLQLTRDLQTRGSLHQISLQFLTWDDVQNYLHLEFPEDRFPEAFQRLVYEKTEGSPLFMVDLLRYLRDQEVIVQRDGVWELTRDVAEIEREIPASIRSMIERKIDQLNEDERRILIAASVQGAEFDSAVVARALEIDAAEAEEIVARLDRVHEFVGVIGEQEHPDGTPTLRYRFVHVLYQNTLYGLLGPARKVSLSAKVANAHLAMASDKLAPIASQLALLFETARDFGKATAFFLMAAQHARRLYANQEAILLARRGLDTAARIANAAERQAHDARLHELLGDVLALIGRHDEAQASYTEALQSLTPEDALARARVHRKSANECVVQRSYPEAALSFDRAEQVLESMPLDNSERWREWIEIQADCGWMYYWQADLTALEQLAKKTEPHLQTRATPSQRAKFLNVLVMAGFRRDRYAISNDTLALAEATMKAAQEAGEPALIRMGEFMMGFSHMWRNELDAAQSLLHTSLQKSERAGDIVLQSRCLTYLTMVARKRHDDDGVRHFAERSLAIAQVAGMPEYVAVAKANYAWLAWRQRNFDEVLRIGREAIEVERGLPLAGPNWWAVCFPMIDTLLQLDRSAEAIELAQILIQPQQHRLNDALQRTLQQSVGFWTEGRPDEARQQLQRACDLAQQSLFL
jgi:tRNA A-37 threonylcarbamoyl transferase component Bud32/tetratricopeptide (TPR) repeat protein